MSGHSIYNWELEKDLKLIVIRETEDGHPGVEWAWSLDQKELAEVFWEALKSETAARGDLRATFIRPEEKR